MRAADLRRQEGFGVIEVLVAAFVLILGILGVLASIDGGRNLVTTSEKKEAAVHVGQKQLEYIESLPYATIGLTATPSTSTDPNDPRYYMQAGPPAKYNWNHGGTANYETVVTGTGVAPTETWSDGRYSGTVHRFVTWVNDPASATTTDYKRLTVAVTLDGTAYPKKPIVFSSIIRDISEGK